jgi:hypothetical protein
MHGANSTPLPAVPFSPDPLVRNAWDHAVDPAQLQQCGVLPVAAHAEPEPAGKAKLAVKGQGWIRLDFSAERPAWLGFDPH